MVLRGLFIHAHEGVVSLLWRFVLDALHEEFIPNLDGAFTATSTPSPHRDQHTLSNPKFPLTSVLTYCCQCPTTSNLTSSFYSPQCAPYSLCPLNSLYPLPYRAYTQCPLLSCLLCSVPLFSMSPFSRYPLPQCPLLLEPLLSVPPTLIDTSS